ncbi:MAG: hypothetical protein H6730_06680 [Deltaproteobacteria bacterium]|nr:hypothetical protein [Deltaproteobacteria bacterium]
MSGVLVLGAAGCKDEQKAAEEQAKQAQARALELAAQAEAAAEQAREAAAKAHAEAGEAAEDAPQNVQDALARMQDAMKAKIVTNVEPVDFRKLKERMPESVEGLKRTKAEGQKTNAVGMKVSMADARYEGEGGARLDLKVVDMGSMRGFAAMAATGWAAVEIDKETDDGYEKTTTFEGNRAMEKVTGDRAELKVIVANRFMVEATADKVKMDTVKAVVKGLDLATLAELK